MGGYRRIEAVELAAALARPDPPLLLDVRTRDSFASEPKALPGAVSVLLDAPEIRVPPSPPERPVVAYCLCSAEASSARVALWMAQAGHRDVAVLHRGLAGWVDAGLPTAPAVLREAGADWLALGPRPAAHAPDPAAAGLVPFFLEQTFLAGMSLPVRRKLAVLFTDMVDSTRLLYTHPPDHVLRLVQCFMEVLVDVGIQHCGDVKDFEGDGALTLFGGPGEALAAAFDLRDALDARRVEIPDLPHARFAVDAGPLVVGEVGTRLRRGISFVGPAVNVAARILRLAPPDGIVATNGILEAARYLHPALAARFRPLPERQHLRGIDGGLVVHVSAADEASAAAR